MKTHCLLAIALLAAATAAVAQEAPPTEPVPAEPTPPAEVAPAPVPAAPTALFPELNERTRPTPVPATAAAVRAGRKKGNRRNSQYATDAATTQANSDPLELRIAYRKAKTRALLDPALADLPNQADAARTDEEKRAILRTYYTRLYAAIRKIDRTPAMKAHVDLLSKASEQRYDPKRRSLNGEDDLAGVGRNGGRNRR